MVSGRFENIYQEALGQLLSGIFGSIFVGACLMNFLFLVRVGCNKGFPCLVIFGSDKFPTLLHIMPSGYLSTVFDFVGFILDGSVELLSMWGCFLLLMDARLMTSFMACFPCSFFQRLYFCSIEF